MGYKQYRSYCLAGESGFPAEAVPVSAPFAPLLLLRPPPPVPAAACIPWSPWPKWARNVPWPWSPRRMRLPVLFRIS